ncbi:MAG: hypothetical protein ACD_20C00022G0018 [uncultured bacterium]|nr:MAG: hypothetical protein ACD_20C00022G0018 [uncultured bacterium]HBH18633.1 hypothetical protein [Cyanobacteria bacterium UBA9579]
MSKKLRVSYTKLSFYSACPKRYYYRYVEKRPYYPTVMTKYGSNIHRSLKDFSEIIRSGQTIDKEVQETLYEKQWTSVSKDDSKNLELKNLGLKQLQDFVDSNINVMCNTIYLEKSFSFPFEDIVLCGYIDRVDKLDNDKVEIIDYKTGNIRNLPQDDLQLNFYALVCRDYFNLTPAKLSLYFLKTNQKTSVDADNKCIDLIRNLIITTADKILYENFIPTGESLLYSKDCCYQRICPESKQSR